MEEQKEISPQDLANKFKSKSDLYNRLTKDCKWFCCDDH